MSRKQFRDTVDDSWGVNCLTLEVFHDVKEAVVDVRLVVKLHFDLVKVSQGIIQNRLLALCDAAWHLVPARGYANHRGVLLACPTAFLRVLRL